jgi:hypothetical protein
MNPDIFLPVLCAFANIVVFLTAPERQPPVRDLAPLEYPIMKTKPEWLPWKYAFINDHAIKQCGNTYCRTPKMPIDRLITHENIGGSK